MEANVPQKNNGATLVEADLPQVGNQLRYPFDYETQRALEEFLGGQLVQAYPVGSIYMNVTDSTNPGILFGYGTWAAIEGYVVAGYKFGDVEFGTPGATLGEKQHQLLISEMPSHTHAANNTVAPGLGIGAWGGGAGNTATGVSGSTGGDGHHNNIQPTIVAYMWQRIT